MSKQTEEYIAIGIGLIFLLKIMGGTTAPGSTAAIQADASTNISYAADATTLGTALIGLVG